MQEWVRVQRHPSNPVPAWRPGRVALLAAVLAVGLLSLGASQCQPSVTLQAVYTVRPEVQVRVERGRGRLHTIVVEVANPWPDDHWVMVEVSGPPGYSRGRGLAVGHSRNPYRLQGRGRVRITLQDEFRKGEELTLFIRIYRSERDWREGRVYIIEERKIVIDDD